MPAAANHQNGHIISFRELQDILLVSALKIAQHFQKPIFTSTFHSPRFMIQHFENSEKKRAALGYILQPFFFFMSLLCIFYFVRVVPGPCANLSWFENHQKCLKVFRQCENSKLCNNAVHPSVSIVIISIQYQCIDLKAIDNDE